ncbi:MAG: DUF3486 family protein [Candidatus Competibacter sp.]|nr:DUF3486 family protein [Candidatus Competibacter sp.]MDG4606461.1 DUF3486 family protein [Candidatus Contendobacter sp.]MDS4059287.1 DUF3486 family protein [Candidatus Contendobacter sp.]HRD49782.1 DUF3486 family protein [Candidatus Contendobacter sp.]
MPAPAKIALLPNDVRQALDRRLVGNAFSDYHALAAWLGEQGYEIGKSAIHHYGQGLKRKLAAIQASTEAARLIAESAPDDEDRRSEAVMSLLQSEIFTVMVNLQDAEDAPPDERVKLLSTVARAIADLSRASINQKKHAAAVKAKLDALLTDAQHGDSGLDIATVQRIRTEVYGLAA